MTIDSLLKRMRKMRRSEKDAEWHYYLTIAICETEKLLPHHETEPFDASGYTGEW